MTPPRPRFIPGLFRDRNGIVFCATRLIWCLDRACWCVLLYRHADASAECVTVRWSKFERGFSRKVD